MLPTQYFITPPVKSFTQTLDLQTATPHFLEMIKNVLTRGVRLIQFRDKELSLEEYASLAKKIAEITKTLQAKLLLNGKFLESGCENASLCGEGILIKTAADGIHLPSNLWKSLKKRPQGIKILGLSCHTLDDFNLIRSLNPDFATLSPIQKSQSHPNEPPLGWDVFQEAALISPCPLYALGGLQPSDVEKARQRGGIGIAGIRGFY